MQIAMDLLHESGDCGGIGNLLATRLRRDHFLYRRAGASWADVAEGVAPAGEAGIGRNLDDDNVERRNRRGALPKARSARVIGNADMVRPDVRDQHVLSLSARE